MRNKKKNRENTCQRKQLHAQDNIYMVRQFAYVHRVAGISLLSGKNTEYKIATTIFFSHIKNMATTQHKTLKLESRFHMSAPAWAYRPKPPLHELSLSKSPIKNHATLFESGRVVKLDQTNLGSTKPNSLFCEVHISILIKLD